MDRSRARKAVSRRLQRARLRVSETAECATQDLGEDAPASLELPIGDDAEPTLEACDPVAPTPAAEHDLTPPAKPPAPPPAEDDEPPFDPPDEDDDIFGKTRLPRSETEADADAEAAGALPERPPAPGGREGQSFSHVPAPRIAITAFWDRPEMAQVLADLTAHDLMRRTEIRVERGGLDGAGVRLAARETPDLIIVDTTLRGAEMLRVLEQIAPAIDAGAKVIVIGAVNDISLLRELAGRGVSHYLVSPVAADDLARTICELYAQTDNSRVVAVIGARGGVGASTFAYNLAWSIAARHGVDAALMDFDLAFGTAAFHAQEQPPYTLADLLVAPHDADDAFLERVAVRPSPRLRLLSAPASLDRAPDVDGAAVVEIIGRVRRTTSIVVLDLPHRWTRWIKQTLLAADDVFIVAEPDLSSLRNCKNMLDALAPLRVRDASPAVLMSMAGVPKRPEISRKEFADAVGVLPLATIDFDPDAFGLAVVKAKAIGEVAPQSKAAQVVDALASAITGRAPIDVEPAETFSFPPAAVASANERPQAPETDAGALEAEAAPLDLVSPATAEQEYIERARTAALADLHAHLKGKHRQKIRGNGRIRRAAAALIALLLVGGFWRDQNGTQAATLPQPAPSVARASVDAQGAPADADLVKRYDEALALMQAGEVLEGAAQLRDIAARGYPPAQYRLAKLYESGDGAPPDLALARQWTERAAAAGNLHAMHDLGVYYARGDGGLRDEMGAFRWFTLAAERGVADSQYNLGVLYAQGRGVAADPCAALEWFLIAAQNGDAAASSRVRALEAQLGAPQIAEAQARAAAFRPAEINRFANRMEAERAADAAPPAPAG
ncbi:MAG TPA: AAA family ATPase [Caulobacterales bacterium]|nr:AAA family ATPase [Caulobacterales bacterium]